MAVCSGMYLIFSSLVVGTVVCQFQAGYNPGGDPNHQGGNIFGGGGGNLPWSGHSQQSATQFTNPCLPLPCMIRCDYGYRTQGPGGCQYCICNAPPVTTAPSLYNNPCETAPSTCDAKCNGNYLTGPNGCQYCACARSTGSPPPTPSTTLESVTPSAADCAIHITNCQIKCPYGFMTDNTQCDMCICKDEIYKIASVPPERQPLVILSNPCIQGFDRCMIACSSGYRTGPRSCQYCACQE